MNEKEYLDYQQKVRDAKDIKKQEERDRLIRETEFRKKAVRKLARGTGKTPKEFMADMSLDVIKAVELIVKVDEIKWTKKVVKNSK